MPEFVTIQEQIERRTYIKGTFNGQFIGYLDYKNSDLAHENFYDLEVLNGEIKTTKDESHIRHWQTGEPEEFQPVEQFLTKLPESLPLEVQYKDGTTKNYHINLNEPKLSNYSLSNQVYEHDKIFGDIAGNISGYLKHYDIVDVDVEVIQEDDGTIILPPKSAVIQTSKQTGRTETNGNYKRWEYYNSDRSTYWGNWIKQRGGGGFSFLELLKLLLQILVFIIILGISNQSNRINKSTEASVNTAEASQSKVQSIIEDKTTSSSNTLTDYLQLFSDYTDLKNGYYIVNNGGVYGGKSSGYKNVGGKWGIVNKDQQIVVPLIYDDLDIEYNQDMIWWKKDGKYGLFDLNGKPKNEMVYDDISSNTLGGYFWIKKDNKWGVIDSTSKLIIQPRFNNKVRSSIYKYENNITISNNYLVLDDVLINLNSLEEMSMQEFTFVSNVNCGTVVIQNNKKGTQYLFDLDKQSYNFKSKYIQHYHDCFYSFSNTKPLDCSNLILNSYSGLISSMGEVLIKDGLYDGIMLLDDNFIGVCNDCEIWGCGNASECACSLNHGKWGVHNISGKIILNVEYELETLENHLEKHKNFNLPI